MSNLTKLTGLWMWGNTPGIVGTVPVQLGKLELLKVCYLDEPNLWALNCHEGVWTTHHRKHASFEAAHKEYSQGLLEKEARIAQILPIVDQVVALMDTDSDGNLSVH